MATFLLTSDGDFDISSGTLKVTSDPAIEFRQKVNARLRSFKGEWFRNLRSGMPWFQRILGIKNPPMSEVQGLIRKAVLSIPGALSITFTLTEFDTTRRKLRINFSVTTDFSAQPLNFNDALRDL
jgi:hypothetical protein